jgi:truncated hemoglobin YjbI
MGFKIDNSHVDAWLSKMEAAIENIASLTAVGNLVVNQLMEHEAVVVVIAKVASTKEPKWTTVMAKNVR